jgi:prepilin-type N-terminal cleavage/methylation domain-containing protein
MTAGRHKVVSRKPSLRPGGGSRAGFTLLELMVALTAGMIAITSIYFVSAASSRHFHEQQRIARTQMNLRMAMEQLRRDIQRAGFLGTPSSDAEQTCATPASPVQAIELLDDEDTGELPQAATNGVTADRLRLTGNYLTAGEYLAIGLVNSTGNQIRLQRDWQAFQQEFGVFGGGSYDADHFEEVFSAGRMLHITTRQGYHFFVRITGSTGSSATISFTPGIGPGSGVAGHCIGGLADGATVAPLSRIEYRVEDLTNTDEGSSLAPTGGAVTDPDADFRGQIGTQLTRREIRFDNTDQVGNNERIVLEYVAGIEYGLVVDNETVDGNPPDLDFLRGGAAETFTTNNPQRVRGVRVMLSARTPEQSPRFPWVASAAGNPANGVPPTRYRVVDPNNEFEGAARVRTMRAEILLPNLANRNLR